VNSRIESNVKVILEFTEEEALWLKGVVQNPINLSAGANEGSHEYDIRIKFYDVLKNVGKDGCRGVKKESGEFLGEVPKFISGLS
jgi:hypothetical protein